MAPNSPTRYRLDLPAAPELLSPDPGATVCADFAFVLRSALAGALQVMPLAVPGDRAFFNARILVHRVSFVHVLSSWELLHDSCIVHRVASTRRNMFRFLPNS